MTELNFVSRDNPKDTLNFEFGDGGYLHVSMTEKEYPVDGYNTSVTTGMVLPPEHVKMLRDWLLGEMTMKVYNTVTSGVEPNKPIGADTMSIDIRGDSAIKKVNIITPSGTFSIYFNGHETMLRSNDLLLIKPQMANSVALRTER